MMQITSTYYFTVTDLFIVWRRVWRIGPIRRMVSVHVTLLALNTRNKITKWMEETKQFCMVTYTNRKQLPTNHSGNTGYLSMVLNQRRLTAASDWESYQAKSRNTKHRTKTLNAHPNSCPDQAKTET
jgi:hypothetical protein